MTRISEKTFLNVFTLALIIAVSTLLAHPIYVSTLDLLGVDAIYPLPKYCAIPDSISCREALER